MPTSAANLRSRLRRGWLVLDGAMGTELERRGLAAPLPLWSAGALLSAPDAVAAVHRDYLAAGADILVANTFRTNPRTLRSAGRFDDGERLNHLAVDLAHGPAASLRCSSPPAWRQSRTATTPSASRQRAYCERNTAR